MNDEMKVKRDTRTDLERNLEHFEQVLNVIISKFYTLGI